MTFEENPVSRFLVIDQPSQVYFPEAWPSLDQAPGDGRTVQDADINGVRRIFGALSKFMDNVGQQFQMLITEHAGSITWEGSPHVHLVGNWRRDHDEFLIPDAWIGSQEE